jgi:hypothetical protein
VFFKFSLARVAGIISISCTVLSLLFLFCGGICIFSVYECHELLFVKLLAGINLKSTVVSQETDLVILLLCDMCASVCKNFNTYILTMHYEIL